MPAMAVPLSGLSFGGSPPVNVPSMFGLALRDGVIEEMIRCYNSNKPIQLCLGEQPSLQYGSKIQHLSTSTEPFTQELFRSSNPNSQSDSTRNSTTKSDSMPDNMDDKSKMRLVREIPQKPCPGFLIALLGQMSKSKLEAVAKKRLVTTKVYEPIPSDPALAALQNSLASENAKKAENTTKIIEDGAGLPAPGRRSGPSGKSVSKSKHLSQNRALVGDTARSMPSSPGLSGAGSPSLGPTPSLSGQMMAEAKITRKPLVHFLAVGPLTEIALRAKIPSLSNSEIKEVLEKIGELNQSTGKWEMRKGYYKELDVWAFDYATSNDRQRAIDNAVKQYDRMRMGNSEPEWDKLLTPAERGTGKCLSKLQAQIAQGVAARPPKTAAQKAEGSSRDGSNGEDEGTSSDKKPASAKSESTTRPTSRAPPAKVKKTTEKVEKATKVDKAEKVEKSEKAQKAEKAEKAEKVLQTKRWMSAKKVTKPKTSPVKKERPAAKQGKFLSAQFVSESDDDDEEMAPVNPAPTSTKRSREGEEETSDSSIPLSKKRKEDHTHRTSEASQSSRTTSTSSPHVTKAKGSSPQKSSPLSSPPTNASEFERSSSGHVSSSASPAHHNAKGRQSPVYKRHQKSSSVTSSVSSSSSQRSLNPDVVDLARRYRSFYPKYEALHREVANSGGRRNPEREQELLDMHERLSELKKQILTGIVYVEN